MEITAIEVFQVDLPCAGGVYQLSGGRTYSTFDATVVRLTTDTGLDPRRVERVNGVMDAALAGHLHATTPIDVACWDLFGKAADTATERSRRAVVAALCGTANTSRTRTY